MSVQQFCVFPVQRVLMKNRNILACYKQYFHPISSKISSRLQFPLIFECSLVKCPIDKWRKSFSSCVGILHAKELLSPLLWTNTMNKRCIGKADFPITLSFQGLCLSPNLENRHLSWSCGNSRNPSPTFSRTTLIIFWPATRWTGRVLICWCAGPWMIVRSTLQIQYGQIFWSAFTISWWPTRMLIISKSVEN